MTLWYGWNRAVVSAQKSSLTRTLSMTHRHPQGPRQGTGLLCCKSMICEWIINGVTVKYIISFNVWSVLTIVTSTWEICLSYHIFNLCKKLLNFCEPICLRVEYAWCSWSFNFMSVMSGIVFIYGQYISWILLLWIGGHSQTLVKIKGSQKFRNRSTATKWAVASLLRHSCPLLTMCLLWNGLVQVVIDWNLMRLISTPLWVSPYWIVTLVPKQSMSHSLNHFLRYGPKWNWRNLNM